MYRFDPVPPSSKEPSGNLVGLGFFTAVIAALALVLSLIILSGNSAISYLAAQENSLSQAGDSLDGTAENLALYNIAIKLDKSDPASQAFFATNNGVEQLFGSSFDGNPQEFGRAVAMANSRLMAVALEDTENRLVVLLLEKDSGGQWQQGYRFSYESDGAGNYKIPEGEVPADSDDLLFGASLAFYGNNVLAIGASGWQGAAIADDTSTTDLYEADDGTNMGAVYIFRLQGGTWNLASTIRGSAAQGQFGSAVSFSPSGKLIVGAPATTFDACPVESADEPLTVPANEDVDNDGDIDEEDTKQTYNVSSTCPAIHIYESSGQSFSQWSKTSSISASSPDEGGFGWAVDFADDELLAVGAPLQYAPTRIAGEGYTRRVGGVHLYAKNSDGDWIKELVVSDFHTDDPGNGKYQIDLDDLDYFGHALTFLDTETLVISGEYKGVLYVLQKSAGSWSQIASIEGSKLLAGKPLHINDEGYASSFGQAVASYGNTLAASSSANKDPSNAYVISLLDWSTFESGTTWHYSYISDANCGSEDFTNNPEAYTEGDLIVPDSDKEGLRLCFKADSDTNGVEYFASDAIDLSVPQFSSPNLNISEDGILSIYFNEIVRQLGGGEIDETWLRANVDSLEIALYGQTNPSITIALNHSNSSSSLNSGNSLAGVSHAGGQTVLRIQIDSADTNFPPATAPTVSAPHTYSIELKNFEDLQGNAQTTAVTAEAQITGYADSPPVITITPDSDQSVSADDNLGINGSTFAYVWLDAMAACNETADFGTASTYTEGDSVRFEEAHNGLQICFKATNSNDSSLVGYKSYQVSGVDRSPPAISVTLRTTTLSAAATDVSPTTWVYVVLSERICNETTDFSSATAYSEASEITVDSSPGSTQANKYYCFRAVDSHDNTSYKASGQIGGSPSIQKITLGGHRGSSQDLFGIGSNLRIQIYFDEPVFASGGERSMYVHVNSQDSPSNLNAYNALNSDLANGLVAFWYVVQRNDSTNNLQALEIIIEKDSSIRDADGNDAILDLDGLVIVDENNMARNIVIDGFKPTITLTQPDMSAWTETKTVSAVDDEADNDSNWDYHFIDAEKYLLSNPFGQPLEIRCYLGDFLDSEEGTPYTEGDDIVLTEEHVGEYLCLRSRRAKSELWDSWNRDRAGSVTDLIQKIDGSPPLISLRGYSKQITPVVTDDASGVRDDSLFYKLIEAEAECNADTFSGDETAYVSGQAIDIPSEYYGSHLCFTASDEVDNTAYEKSRLLQAKRPNRRDTTPPNIIVENPEDSEPENRKLVSADSDSPDTVDSSWIFKIYDEDTADCDQALMSEGFSAYRGGRTIVLDDEEYNGLSVCFSVSDEAGNEAFAASAVISGIDRQPPVIIASLDDGNAVAVDDDSEPTTWKYRIILGNVNCDEVVLATDQAQAYVEGSPVSLTAYEGYKACFKATDEAGNSGFGASSVAQPVRRSVTVGEEPIVDESGNADNNLQEDDNSLADDTKEQAADSEVSSKIVSEEKANNSFYLWWLLLSAAIFFIILFLFRRRRQDEEYS